MLELKILKELGVLVRKGIKRIWS